MKSFFEILPEEILEQILLKLPPKSLKCCERVCKLWYVTITNRQFIEKQLNVSMENNRLSSPATLCFLWTTKKLSKKEVFTGRYENDDDKKQVLSIITIHEDDNNNNNNIGGGDRLPCLIEKINLPAITRVKKRKWFPPCLSATHCNGIVCLYDCNYANDTVFLCNMEIGEFKPLRTLRLSPRFMFSGVGFGYDCRAGEYKLVKFFSCVGFQTESRALVLTLGTESWREIDLKGIFCWLNSDPVYCGGFTYWWNTGATGSGGMILALDMSEEEIHRVELPPVALSPSGKFFRLTVWNDAVAIFISTEVSTWRSFSFEMWVMVRNSNNGVEGFAHLNKLLTIGPLAGICSALSFWKDDELLLQTKYGRIVSFNIRTRKLKLLSIPVSIFPPSSSGISCLKTLVSVRR